MSSAGKPRVAVVGTGGTISSVGKHGLDLVNYGNNNTKYNAVEQVDASRAKGAVLGFGGALLAGAKTSPFSVFFSVVGFIAVAVVFQYLASHPESL